jgi:hypothetical protein
MSKIGEWAQLGLTYQDVFDAGDTAREMHGLPPKHRKEIVNSDAGGGPVPLVQTGNTKTKNPQ